MFVRHAATSASHQRSIISGRSDSSRRHWRRLRIQGNRALTARKSSDKSLESFLVPPADFAFAAKASFEGSVALQHIQC